ncbi:hypothetical protein DFH06DRAFT_1138112 [Mycena polygramma]|nr:hypothetical protein DFH06DRAFT_1138112 [Mycena polygramma]
MAPRSSANDRSRKWGDGSSESATLYTADAGRRNVVFRLIMRAMRGGLERDGKQRECGWRGGGGCRQTGADGTGATSCLGGSEEIEECDIESPPIGVRSRPLPGQDRSQQQAWGEENSPEIPGGHRNPQKSQRITYSRKGAPNVPEDDVARVKRLLLDFIRAAATFLAIMVASFGRAVVRRRLGTFFERFRV